MLPFNETTGTGEVTDSTEIASDVLLRDADVAMEEVRTHSYFTLFLLFYFVSIFFKSIDYFPYHLFLFH